MNEVAVLLCCALLVSLTRPSLRRSLCPPVHPLPRPLLSQSGPPLCGRSELYSPPAHPSLSVAHFEIRFLPVLRALLLLLVRKNSPPQPLGCRHTPKQRKEPFDVYWRILSYMHIIYDNIRQYRVFFCLRPGGATTTRSWPDHMGADPKGVGATEGGAGGAGGAEGEGA